MANLRRTKLKAKRCGCDVKEVDKCVSLVEVHALVIKNNTDKSIEANVSKDKDNNLVVEVSDGISE